MMSRFLLPALVLACAAPARPAIESPGPVHAASAMACSVDYLSCAGWSVGYGRRDWTVVAHRPARRPPLGASAAIDEIVLEFAGGRMRAHIGQAVTDPAAGTRYGPPSLDAADAAGRVIRACHAAASPAPSWKVR